MVGPAAPRYKWRRLSEEGALALRNGESALRRAAETAAGEAAGRGAAPPEALCAVDLMGVLQPLARAAAGLSLAGMDLAATRQRAYAALHGFGAAYSGVSASRLGQELYRAESYDLIPEMAGGVTPLGRIGAEAMRRVGVEASRSLKRGELEAVLGDTARAAADHKTAEAAGAGGESARAGGESEPAARPFAGRGKERRQTESLGFIASNVCSFGLGVELRNAGATALEGEETEPDMGDGCDMRTREGDTLQAAFDQLEGGGHAVGVYSETRAVDLAAIDGHVRRRSAGFDCRTTPPLGFVFVPYCPVS